MDEIQLIFDIEQIYGIAPVQSETYIAWLKNPMNKDVEQKEKEKAVEKLSDHFESLSTCETMVVNFTYLNTNNASTPRNNVQPDTGVVLNKDCEEFSELDITQYTDEIYSESTTLPLDVSAIKRENSNHLYVTALENLTETEDPDTTLEDDEYGYLSLADFIDEIAEETTAKLTNEESPANVTRNEMVTIDLKGNRLDEIEFNSFLDDNDDLYWK